MNKDSALHSLSPELSITQDNRHQYLDTASVTQFSAERQINRAEERGRRRKLCEQRRQRHFKIAAIGLLATLMAGTLTAALLY